jgi:cleavage and polyadenylation specificity factor subunit 3
LDNFSDDSPSVIMASPGMIQNGLSREIFEKWCHDPKNGCIITGYCVDNTLAKVILNQPD